jgi:hypothetical protein
MVELYMLLMGRRRDRISYTRDDCDVLNGKLYAAKDAFQECCLAAAMPSPGTKVV